MRPESMMWVFERPLPVARDVRKGEWISPQQIVHRLGDPLQIAGFSREISCQCHDDGIVEHEGIRPPRIVFVPSLAHWNSKATTGNEPQILVSSYHDRLAHCVSGLDVECIRNHAQGDGSETGGGLPRHGGPILNPLV